MSTNEQKAGFIKAILTRCGISETWAKVIAGAIIGALAAAGVLSATGCTMDYSQSASGEIHWQGVIVLPVDNAK